MPSPTTDRNLLFGILALQMDFIRRDALIAAMQAWVFAKQRPLGDILVEQGALPAERRSLLDALVQEHLRQHDNDPRKSLAAVSSLGSARQALEQIADPEVHATLSQVAAGRGAEGLETRPPTVGEATSAGTRFRILRPHARGGLGEVFVAEDGELHREVALKEIQDRHADNPTSRARFMLEAEITGGLEHPGIVPVYGLGQYGDGRPFYAMRFIRGDSLKEAIERYHGKAALGLGERAVQFRKLLGRFLDVCNAIAYAHSRGILHRDLKPGNIMLGKYGETLVVDWGLAKAVHDKQPENSEEAPLRPSSQSGSVETVAGSAMGTPQFMSPEQAAGRLDQLGPASDVYSLGATLYTLLTGQPSVTDKDVGAVLQKVQKGDFPPPRQVKKDVPRALEAICLKAMALRPQDRYESPRSLADEVEHWLADEPVTAFREPLAARVRRWGRRHRATVTATAAAVLVALVGLVTATVLLTAANDRERAERDKARERFKLARDAVDKFHTQVSESPEMKAEGVEKLRTRLLETAISFYEKFAQEEGGNDPEVQAEHGHTFSRLAHLCGETGRYEQAEKAYRNALAIQEKLVAEYPTFHEYEGFLGVYHYNLGMLFAQVSRPKDAEAEYRAALYIQKRLVAAYPDMAVYERQLAFTHHGLGGLFQKYGRPKEAEAAYLDALEIDKRLDDQEGMAIRYNNLATLYFFSRPNEAEAAFRAALELRKKQAAGYPADHYYQNQVAKSYRALGSYLSIARRYKEAETALRAAVDTGKKLTAKHPTSAEYQRELAQSHDQLGVVFGNTSRSKDGEAEYRSALDIRDKLATQHPTVTSYQGDLTNSHISLAVFYANAGRHKEAEAEYRAALTIAKKLAAQHPTVVRYQEIVARSVLALCDLLTATSPAEAEELLRVALDIRKKLVARYSGVPQYQIDLAASHEKKALFFARSGRAKEAEMEYRIALDLRKKLVAKYPTVIEYRNEWHFRLFGGRYLQTASAAPW